MPSMFRVHLRSCFVECLASISTGTQGGLLLFDALKSSACVLSIYINSKETIKLSTNEKLIGCMI